MSTLNSTSTLEEVQASYDDNASYAEDQSVSKARAFVTAVRILLRRIPQRIDQTRRFEIEQDLRVWREELKAAQAFVTAFAAGGGVRQFSLTNFRR